MSEQRASGAGPVAVWLVPIALLYLVALGAAPLFDVDEGAFAEATREMLASGDWGHTTLNGADRFDKPILVYWLQAISMSLLGVNEFSARLPSALAAICACGVLVRVGGLRLGHASGVIAALMLASASGFALIGRAATADGLLNALLIATCVSLWRFALDREVAALRWAALWCGLGLLAKGPVALLVPGASFLLWALSQRDGALLRRSVSDGWSWLIVLAVAGPWYAYALARHGMAFVDGFLLRHNVERFSGTLEGHGGSLLYYVVVLPVLFMPWTPLLVWIALHLRSLWQTPAQRFLLIWALFVLGFFSLSGTKLPHYVLYGMAPLALLGANVLCSPLSAGWQRALWFSTVAQGLLLLGLAQGAAAWEDRIATPWVQAIVHEAALERGQTAWLAASVAGVVLLGLAPGPLQAVGSALRLALAGCVTTAGLCWWVVPWWSTAQQGPVRELALKARAQQLEVVQWKLHQPSLGFYAAQPAARRAPDAGQWALVNTLQLQQDPHADCARIQGRAGYALVTAADRPWSTCFGEGAR